MESLIIDKLFPVYDEEVYRKSLLEIFLEICLNISLIVYILRNIVEKIQFPLDGGVAGYEHKRVSEIKGGVLIAFAVITFQPNFKNKVTLLINRFK